MTDKRALRREVRLRRDRFVACGTPVLPVPSAFRDALRPGSTVASYVPLGSEAGPPPLARAAIDAGCAIALPHVVDRAMPIRFLAWRDELQLVVGPFGLSQPAHDAPEVVPDIILTPLVAFDAALNRLGQGAGHYDRAFATWPDARRIGVAWSVQEVEELPVDPWDLPLHAIVTERGWRAR